MYNRFGRFTNIALLAFALAPVGAAAQTGGPAAPGEPGAVRAPTAAPPPAVPDAAFRAMIDRPVAIRLQNGAVVAGRLVAVDERTVTLIVAPSNDVVSFDKRSIAGLRATAPVATGPGPEAAAPLEVERLARPAPRDPNRHFALLAGVTPSLAVDFDYRLVYAFAAVSLAFPLATGGETLPMAFGAGVNLHVARDPRWKFEIFAHYSPVRWDGALPPWYHVVGAGVGLHFTSERGFTFGFKAPVLGYAVHPTQAQKGSDGVAAYYGMSFVSLPVISFGYRF